MKKEHGEKNKNIAQITVIAAFEDELGNSTVTEWKESTQLRP